MREIKFFDENIHTRDIKLGDTNIISYTIKNGYCLSYKEYLTFDCILPSGRAFLTNGRTEISHEYPFKSQLEPDIYGFVHDIFKLK